MHSVDRSDAGESTALDGEISSAPILIAGPTASGKSALALTIARQVNGIIINADSMQVYRELRILTARPSADDEAIVPHALYGSVSAAESYSAGRFIRDVSRVLSDAKEAGQRPIIVGGTGLYFKALLEGLSPIPEIDPAVRARWRGEADRAGEGELHRLLAARDSVMASRLAPGDTQRIVRALEVIEQTGKSLAEWQALPKQPISGAEGATKILVRRERSDLLADADARFDRMMDQGAMDEAVALGRLGLDPGLPAMRAIGVGALIAASEGKLTVADAVAAAKVETRQYIKRQGTWFRRHMISWSDAFKK
ncbi:tRNA (adenosine(37)-N6)-dimethylallyltransferase MiaA [Hyphomicrobium methylovorum]|nr:tRNA (adenosine(37)-N6)-dimethylallyltransferase MiaA [Hyphomicrobium methylovorum]MBA2127354.1 tRNA (adenosine(37)-N6)-dimethylallyltransferase MiaA [Hyphomicrobium methylovorum]